MENVSSQFLSSPFLQHLLFKAPIVQGSVLVGALKKFKNGEDIATLK